MPPSLSPNLFDPTTVSGRSKPMDPRAPVPPVELVLETPVLQKVSTIAVRPEDKEVFDALQSWWRLRYGGRVTQWELFTHLLVAALGDGDQRFAGAQERV
jgi:hypothetical protein